METSVNNKCRAFTSLEQSKKLADILPLESADMYYPNRIDIKYQGALPIEYKHGNPLLSQEIAAWSLAALLAVLPNCTDIVKEETDTENEKYMCTVGVKDDIICTFGNNPIDACYELILKLHELKML